MRLCLTLKRYSTITLRCAFLMPHLNRARFHLTKKFVVGLWEIVRSEWFVSYSGNVSNVAKTECIINVSDQAKPLSTNILGLRDLMRDCFTWSVFTALTLPEKSRLLPLTRTRIHACPCHFVCSHNLPHICDGEPRVLGTEKKSYKSVAAMLHETIF